MEDWVREAHDLLIEYGFRRSLLSTAVKHAHLAVREGCQEIMDISAQAAVPLLVFSAGIADVLEEVCRQQLPKPLPDTVHVVSNRMLFSSFATSSLPSSSSSPTNTIEASNKDQEVKEEGVLIGFTDPVFHVFNKRAASVLETSPYFHQDDYEHRKNVVLVGDSLGDLHMSDGLDAEEILRVGFLNDR